MTLDTLIARIAAQPHEGKRKLVALAGPPAGGKSTLGAHLAGALPQACVVPMDGFHLDNRLLDARGLRARKGAPETFDLAGFTHLVKRLRHEDEVIYPLFDRNHDCAIAGAGHVGPDTHTVIAEGNYLLLDAPGWRDLAAHWDVTVFLDVPEATLRARLLARWQQHGYGAQDARTKADGNDIPNALMVLRGSVPADAVIDENVFF